MLISFALSKPFRKNGSKASKCRDILWLWLPSPSRRPVFAASPLCVSCKCVVLDPAHIWTIQVDPFFCKFMIPSENKKLSESGDTRDLAGPIFSGHHLLGTCRFGERARRWFNVISLKTHFQNNHRFTKKLQDSTRALPSLPSG